MSDIYDDKDKKGHFGRPPSDIIKNIKKTRETKFFSSKFNFLEDQLGWRPGDTHTLIGMESSGKSSLVRSVLLEAACHAKVLVYLSEETTEDIWYELERSYTLQQQHIGKNLGVNPLDNIRLIYEHDFYPDIVSNIDDLLMLFRSKIIEAEAEFLIFDNLTTSLLYETLRPDQQLVFFSKLKSMVKQLKIPLLTIAHTTKNYTGVNMMRSGDIRGSNGPVQLSEHFFCFNNRFIATMKDGEHTTSRRVVLQVTKMRSVDREDLYFYLNYNKKTRLYDKDKAMPIKLAKEVLQAGKANPEDLENNVDIFKTPSQKINSQLDLIDKESDDKLKGII